MSNPVLHSKTKHIQIRHHFIRDCYEQRLINVVKVHTDDNVANLLTKGFDLARFNFLVVTIERKSDETEQVIIEEEKDTSDVKSQDTKELDLERIQSTARQSVVTPRTLNFDD
ncbi:hypothetical protein Tco_0220697, partial [Tanacetum coccineum]